MISSFRLPINYSVTFRSDADERASLITPRINQEYSALNVVDTIQSIWRGGTCSTLGENEKRILTFRLGKSVVKMPICRLVLDGRIILQWILNDSV
jgi:hypothetical protein